MATLRAVSDAVQVVGEFFSDGEIEGGVFGEIGVGVGSGGIGISVDESGAVVDVGRGGDLVGESGVESDIEGVALIVVNGLVVEAGIALRES